MFVYGDTSGARARACNSRRGCRVRVRLLMQSASCSDVLGVEGGVSIECGLHCVSLLMASNKFLLILFVCLILQSKYSGVRIPIWKTGSP